jgi:hypothetical protein
MNELEFPFEMPVTRYRMKKLPQSAGAKVENSRQRMQRRNYQKNATKKTGVHAQVVNAGNPTNPTPEPKPKRRRRKGAYKLNDRTIGALISSINRSADAPIEMHCGCAGIHRETYLEWRKLASEEPEGEHARQMRKVDKALFAAWRRLHEVAVKHKASEVLFRRHHEHYPSERQRLELTGAEGLPLIPTENAFSVVLELHQPAGQAATEPEPGFRIVQPNGSVDLWIPPQPNGQEPPP